MPFRKLRDFFYLIVGTTILAGATNIFFNANQMVVGGFSGLGIILESYTQTAFGWGVPLALTNAVLNLPLFFAAYVLLGKGTLSRTVFATLYFSVALFYTDYLPGYHGDFMLAAVFGGALSGVGIGFVLKGFGTTGGVDLLASIVHKFYGHISVSRLILCMDAAIILLGMFVFGVDKTMYALVAVVVSSKCITAILEGMSFSKAAFIVSDHADELAGALMQDLDRGVTALHGRGMYTGERKDVLLCVFSRKEITRVKEIVKKIDEKAFIMVTDFREVLGEGFQSV